jgi:hypothetical protein
MSFDRFHMIATIIEKIKKGSLIFNGLLPLIWLLNVVRISTWF